MVTANLDNSNRNNFLLAKRLVLDLARSLFNFLCLWEGRVCVGWLWEGFRVLTMPSVNLTCKIHSGLEALISKI